MDKDNTPDATASPMRILVVEDHELTRIGLVHSLVKSERVTVVTEAENGQEAVVMVTEFKPDIILMDIGMPVMDGITATQRIKQVHSDIKVVILTSHKEQREVLAAMSAGAEAYCSKDIRPERLIQVLEMVMEGAFWIDPAIAKTVMSLLKHSSLPGTQADETITVNPLKNEFNLTERELEVLGHMAAGRVNRDIAEIMTLSVYTVKGHVGSIIQKLAVSDRTQAALKALKMGLVQH